MMKVVTPLTDEQKRLRRNERQRQRYAEQKAEKELNKRRKIAKQTIEKQTAKSTYMRVYRDKQKTIRLNARLA